MSTSSLRMLPSNVSSTVIVSRPLPLAGHDVRHLAANEMHAFVLHPVVELLKALAGRADVDVAVVDLGIRLLADQVRQLQRVHAADAGTVRMIVRSRLPTQWTMPTRLGVRAVTQYQLAGRRPAGVEQPLHLQAGVDVAGTCRSRSKG